MEPTRKKKRKWRRRDYVAPGFSLIVLAFLAALYWRHERRQPLSPNPDVARQELLKVLPKGMRLTRAADVMEARGFDCRSLQHSQFNSAGPFDFLYCDRDAAEPGQAGVRRRWQVAIVETNGGVSDVLVTSGLVGP